MEEQSLKGGLMADERRRIEGLGVRLIPPDPALLVEPVDIPPPGMFEAGSHKVSKVRALARIYRDAVRWRFGQESHAYMSGEPEKWRGYAGMLAAVSALEERKIPPAAWCMFSFDEWACVLGKSGLPRPTWVWAPSRIEKHHVYLVADSSRYLSVRRVLAPKHRALVDDWGAMWVSLLASKPRDRAEVAAVVERHFPGRTFDERFLAAKAEAANAQHAARLGAGEQFTWW